jgi:hypothetical protein
MYMISEVYNVSNFFRCCEGDTDIRIARVCLKKVRHLLANVVFAFIHKMSCTPLECPLSIQRTRAGGRSFGVGACSYGTTTSIFGRKGLSGRDTECTGPSAWERILGCWRIWIFWSMRFLSLLRGTVRRDSMTDWILQVRQAARLQQFLISCRPGSQDEE